MLRPPGFNCGTLYVASLALAVVVLVMDAVEMNIRPATFGVATTLVALAGALFLYGILPGQPEKPKKRTRTSV